jgi:hypothetical protein
MKAKILKYKEWSYNALPASMPFLSELMASCRSAPPLPKGQVLMEAGVLAYRCRKNDEPEILLVSKRRSKKWGIPKGRVEPHLNFGELAAIGCGSCMDLELERFPAG